MRSIRTLTVLCVLAAPAATAACNRGDNAELRRADGTVFSSSGGEVALADGSHLDFVITSQRYKQWDAAQSALSRSVSARFGQLLQPKSPTEQTIARAVAYLEGDAGSKQAIARAGMSVKDFVLMTVALEQEMRVASGQSATRSSAALPYSPPIDTTPAVYPVIPRTQVDSTVTVDTVARRPARDTIASKRDSLRPTRDTTRDTLRPPAPSKPPRDTVRDTVTMFPPDLLQTT